MAAKKGLKPEEKIKSENKLAAEEGRKEKEAGAQANEVTFEKEKET